MILIHGIIDGDGLLSILDKGIGLDVLLLIEDAVEGFRERSEDWLLLIHTIVQLLPKTLNNWHFFLNIFAFALELI